MTSSCQVEIIDGSVKIHGTDSLLSSTRRLKQMECASGEDDRMFLLIGGGESESSLITKPLAAVNHKTKSNYCIRPIKCTFPK